MKYMVILDESQFNDFVKDDEYPNAIHLTDKNGLDRVISCKPVQRPTMVFTSGESIYLEPRYIDAMLALDCRLSMARSLNDISLRLNGENKYDVDGMTVRELEKAFPDLNTLRYDGDKNIILRNDN